MCTGAQKEQTKSTEFEERKTRLEYRAPVLREFGPVGTLTQGGTGAMIEGNMGMGSMGGATNPNRRP